jgi:HK97 family phage portal protein
VDVTPETALRVTAVYACVGVIASTLACLPIHLYRRTKGGKDIASDHPLDGILHDTPNDLMTSYEFREVMQSHVCLRGNAYARVRRDGAGRVVSIEPLHPDRVTVYEASGKPFYSFTHRDGHRDVMNSDECLHIRGLGPDGIMGYSPITLAREAIGLAVATEAHGSRFFANGARPSGVIESPGSLKPEQIKELKKAWNEAHSGDQQQSVGVLYGGLKYNSISISNEDAQFLETRKFSVTDIARVFRVPPHKIADLSNATFSNIEHQAIEFVTDCMLPHIVRWEQRINRVLLTPAERKSYFVKISVNALTRGDIKSRYESYRIGREGGWLSPNDIRDLEDQNAIDGGDGYLQPLNFTRLGAQPEAKK